MTVAVIFGGTGFIGTEFAYSLLRDSRFAKIYLVDRESLEAKGNPYRLGLLAGEDRVSFIEADVRESLAWFRPEGEIALIANFAAVHREPGHNPDEYFETNLLGAENICGWASDVECETIIFTSSISPYGPSEGEKTEGSVPSPATAYGGSKLAAELIHRVWQAENRKNRNLLIVRPGVVFGPGEGGNVSRLIKAVRRGYFVYVGNRATRKAGVYVKELINAVHWALTGDLFLKNQGVILFNMTMNPGPSIEDYVEAVCEEANIRRYIPSVPYLVLLLSSYVIEIFAKIVGVNHPFSPTRIRKLVSSNNVAPHFLTANEYSYAYSLKTAFTDWRKRYPNDWK